MLGPSFGCDLPAMFPRNKTRKSQPLSLCPPHPNNTVVGDKRVCMRRSLACDSLKKEKEQRTVTGVTTHMCGSLYHAIEIPRGTGTDEPRVEEPFLSHLSPLRPKPPRAQTSMNSLFAFARKKQPGSKKSIQSPSAHCAHEKSYFLFQTTSTAHTGRLLYD